MNPIWYLLRWICDNKIHSSIFPDHMCFNTSSYWKYERLKLDMTLTGNSSNACLLCQTCIYITLQKYEGYARRNCLVKCYKNYHGIRKSKHTVFFVFHFNRSISLDNFIKNKPLISGEWHITVPYKCFGTRVAVIS